MVQTLQLNNDADQWTYIWGSNIFTANKAYNSLIGSSPVHPIYKWLWKSACQNKIKFFFWLVLKDRLSTRELLRRKSMDLQSYSCVLCVHNVDESLHHLLFDCPFATASWNTLHLLVPGSSSPIQIFEVSRYQLQLSFFLEIIVTMCWAIWTVRNDVIFRGIPASIQRCKSIFGAEFALVILRAKTTLHPAIDLWLEAFV
jgi:multisubunit Na+/H+ antiporter MnhE subunit